MFFRNEGHCCSESIFQAVTTCVYLKRHRHCYTRSAGRTAISRLRRRRAALAEASPPTPASSPLAGAFSVACEWTGELTLLFLRSLDAIARGKVKLEETVRQMSLIGVSSLPISTMIMAFSGMVLALHTANQLKRLGLEGLVGGIVAVSGAREAAPVLTAVAVAARVGSAIAAELGSMTVTEQVDALRSLGVSPINYLAVPRFIAAVVMLPVLTIFANAAALL